MGAFLFILSLVAGTWFLSPLPQILPFLASLPQVPIEVQRQQSWPYYSLMEEIRRTTPADGVLVFHKEARHGVHHARYYLWPRKVLEFHEAEGRRDLHGPRYHVYRFPRELQVLDAPLPWHRQVGPWSVASRHNLDICYESPADPFLHTHPGGRWLWCGLFALLLWMGAGRGKGPALYATLCGALLAWQWNLTPLSFDSLALWMQKAKNLVLTGELAGMVQNAPQPYYPPFYPLLTAALGSAGETAGHIVTLGFVFLLLWSAYRRIHQTGVSEGTSLALGGALILVPAFFLHSFFTMANLPLAAVTLLAAVQLEERKLSPWTLVVLSLLRLEGIAIAMALLWVDRRHFRPSRLGVFIPVLLWTVYAHWVKEPPPLHPLPFPYPARWGEVPLTYVFHLWLPQHWGLVPWWILGTAVLGGVRRTPTWRLVGWMGAGWTLAAVLAIGRWGNDSFFQSFDRYYLPWFALAYCQAASWAASLKIPVPWAPLRPFLDKIRRRNFPASAPVG